MTDKELLISLLQDLEKIKAKQRGLAADEEQYRQDIYALMHKLNLEKEESSYGTVRLQRRAQKDYGEAIRMLERQLKEAKKLAEDMGDYEITGYKESLVYVPPDDPF